jgi:hypothetical protein
MARSRSHSRVQRKRAGTAPSLPVGTGSGSGSGEVNNATDQLRDDTHAHGALPGKDLLDGDVDVDINTNLERIPMRVSMFPLGTRKSPPKLEKATHGVQGSFTDSDLIELVPRTHIRHVSGASGFRDTPMGVEDRMVIRKEVRYSIQYEDDDPRRVEGKAHDVSTYV